MTDDITAHPGEMTKHFLWRHGSSIEIIRGPDDQWRDDQGTVYNLPDIKLEGDNTTVACGVGIFSLPTHWAITDACAPHDLAYSSVTYEKDHTKLEADQMLKRNVYLINKSSIESDLFYALVRIFGGMFWENPKTNT